MQELREIRLKTFGEVAAAELRDRYPILARLADALPDQGGGDRMRGLLRSAVGELSPAHVREAATALFGLSPGTYGKERGFREDIARSCFDANPSASTFRQQPKYLKLILGQLALILLEKASASSGRKERQARGGDATRQGVRRPALEARALAAIQGRTLPLTLWGEGGNGKTFLARNLATEIAARLEIDLPMVVIRLGDSLRTDEPTYQADLIRCLAQVGLAPQAWSLAAQEIALRDLMAGPRCFSTVVLDDVDQAAVGRLVPEACSAPVLITSRVRPAAGGLGIRVDAYEDAEALAAVRQILPVADESRICRLCELLGNRPVAIDISVRLIDGGYATLESLITALVEDAPTTLDSSYELLGENIQKSVVRLYGKINDELSGRPAAGAVIDVLLWLSSGVIERDMLEGYLGRILERNAPRIAHASALAWLGDIGLIRSDAGAIEINGLSRTLLRWLRHGRIDQVIGEYASMLDEVDNFFNPSQLRKSWYSEVDSRSQLAATFLSCHSAELFLMREVFDELFGTGEFVTIAMGVDCWIIGEKDLGFFFDKSENMRWGIISPSPESSMVLWTAAAAPRRLVKKREVRAVFYVTRLFQMLIRSEYDYLLNLDGVGGSGLDPMSRFDWFTTPADGVVHQRIDFYSSAYSAENDPAPWAFCGRRLAEEDEAHDGDPECPECKNRQDSLAGLMSIENAIEAVLAVIDAGSRLESRFAAYLFALRGRIQQLTGRMREPVHSYADYLSAARSYLACFSSMLSSAERGDKWPLDLGIRIIDQLRSLPFPALRARAISPCRSLLPLTEPTTSTHANIDYRIASLLADSGYPADAGEEYDRLLTLLEQGHWSDPPLDYERLRRERAGIGERVTIVGTLTIEPGGSEKRPPGHTGEEPEPGERRAATSGGATDVEVNRIQISREAAVQVIMLKERNGVTYFAVPARLLQSVSALYAARMREIKVGEYVLPHGLAWAVLRELGIDVIRVVLARNMDAVVTLSNGRMVKIESADAVILATWFSAQMQAIPEMPRGLPGISAMDVIGDSGGDSRMKNDDQPFPGEAGLEFPGARVEVRDVGTLSYWAGVDSIWRVSFVFLQEERQGRILSFPVTSPEMIAIDEWINGGRRNRRSTHDMICEVFNAAGIRLQYCRIHKVDSRVMCSIGLPDGKIAEASAGDGIALAIRMNAPIVVDSDLLPALVGAADDLSHPTLLGKHDRIRGTASLMWRPPTVAGLETGG